MRDMWAGRVLVQSCLYPVTSQDTTILHHVVSVLTVSDVKSVGAASRRDFALGACHPVPDVHGSEQLWLFQIFTEIRLDRSDPIYKEHIYMR